VLDCGSFIGDSARAAPLRVVLGVVALPASLRYPALQTSLSGAGNGPLRLFAKTGLLVRPGTTFELIVRAGGKQQQVRIGVGTACPGQRPPQGPSQS